jgi:hypothetical protein
MPQNAVPVPQQAQVQEQEPATDVDSAPQPTGLETSPAGAGAIFQRTPQRATVEEVEDE